MVYRSFFSFARYKRAGKKERLEFVVVLVLSVLEIVLVQILELHLHDVGIV